MPLLRPLSTQSRLRPAHNINSSLTLSVAAFLAAGSAYALHRNQTRGFSSSTLLCEEQQSPKEKESKEDSSLFSLPSLPDLSLPKMPSVSMPDIPIPDLNATIKNWSESLSKLSKSFSDLQNELSGGEGSTVAKILAGKEDENVNEEVAWDATVRLGELLDLFGARRRAEPLEFAGTELGLSERAFLRNRKEAALKPFAKLMGVGESEVRVEDIPIIAMAGSGGGYRGSLSFLFSAPSRSQS